MALQTAPDPVAAGLTPQEAIFCAEYIKDNNASRAYEAAFPYGRSAKARSRKRKLKPTTIRTESSRLMAVPAIKEHIANLVKYNMENALVIQEDTGQLLQRVIRELAAIAFFDLKQFLKVDVVGGKKRPTFDMDKLLDDPIACKALSLEIGTTGDGEGGVIDIFKLKKYGKLEALDKLLKYAMIAEGKATGFGEGGNVAQQMVINVNFPVPGGNVRKQSREAVEADFTESD